MPDPKIVRLLIKNRADVDAADAGKYRPLHLAVMGQRLENTKELIKAGANLPRYTLPASIFERGQPVHHILFPARRQ
ncbi:hypothetical protein NPIL_404931 [Nephila pilipes]|uniref:Ankyrin repeat domain-containing protein n=1 Tax=Nephila pilipes TaxID=299642 RepID=A0A8X6TYW4_NEPPI|nr:hypothetical protein NPIL_404931 [Nephila pilipes]